MIELDESKDVVDLVEDDLRGIEAALERVGRKICAMPGSSVPHGHISSAAASVRDAVSSAYLMRENNE